MNLTGKGPMGQKAPKPAKVNGVRKISKKRAAYQKSAEGKAELAHMAKVKQLPCIICNAPPPSDAHHVIHGRFGSRKPDGFHTIPLCKAHHQIGPDAIHNGKSSWDMKYGKDYSYLPVVRTLLDGCGTVDF